MIILNKNKTENTPLKVINTSVCFIILENKELQQSCIRHAKKSKKQGNKNHFSKKQILS